MLKMEIYARIDPKIASRVDEMVVYFGAPNRSAFIQGILAEYIDIMEKDKERKDSEAKAKV